MRNLFDQYSQPENRLTHALAVCLYEDRHLLGAFVRWVGARSPVAPAGLEILEQSLPGESVASEDEAERRGLPDVVIHDGEAWCVLLESKIQARLTHDQLARHERTLRRRGFSRISCVSLTKAGVLPPAGVTGRSWCELYAWLGKVGGTREWPERMREYLRVAEVRLAREEYLTEGTLTMFDGFKFTHSNPYTYGEAKRLLKLAMAELRADKSLLALGMDPKAPGRDQIRGRQGAYVWDFLQLSDRPRDGFHTHFPHLTLALHTDHLEIAVSIPDKIDRRVRRRLAALGQARMEEMHEDIVTRAKPLVAAGGWVEAFALQRHYKSQSAHPVVDARVVFNLQTSLSHTKTAVKYRPEWTTLFLSLLQRKAANIHFAYAVNLRWGTPGLDSREALRTVASGWGALKPLLDVLRAG